jgi:5-amino-6-(5-phosphoribosylamino)uracil reductase
VSITGRGDLDPTAQFFTAGESAKIVYVCSVAQDKTTERLGSLAEVVDAGDPIELPRILADLAGRGVDRLMVEGGGATHTLFLTEGVVDELQLVIAPFFVGDSNAPRFVHDGTFAWHSQSRARLADVVKIDDVVLLRYALSERYATA